MGPLEILYLTTYANLILFKIVFKIYFAVLDLCCSMLDLGPRPGIKSGPPALWA